MPILARCPGAACGQAVKVKDEFAGKKMRCPRCQGVIAIPAAAAPLPTDSAPPARMKPRPAPAIAQPKPGPEADAFDADDFGLDEPPAKKTKPAVRDDEDSQDRPAKKSG